MSVQTMERMVDWVEQNLENAPTLGKMSGFVGYSPCYCSEKFREYTGLTFQAYLSHRQLDLAARDLRETSLRILDIAVEHGFSSHEAFTRAFRRRFSCTPRQYRRRQQSR